MSKRVRDVAGTLFRWRPNQQSVPGPWRCEESRTRKYPAVCYTAVQIIVGTTRGKHGNSTSRNFCISKLHPRRYGKWRAVESRMGRNRRGGSRLGGGVPTKRAPDFWDS